MSGQSSQNAPIVFFGYNRAKHATWAIESIKACPESNTTPITIYMDGPKNDEGLQAVEEAREAIRGVAPTHARLVYRDENMGLANSLRAGISEACEEHGRVIVVEDDLLLAPTALTYFNRALNQYRDDERVLHVAGFWPEDQAELPPSFFLRWPGVWGWATWGRAWDKLEWDLEVLRDRLQSEGLVDHFSEGGWDFFGQLVGTLEGNYDSWGIRWYASVLLERGLALHPRVSLVANTGNDGSGVHGDASDAFEVDLGSGVPAFPGEVVESAEAIAAWTAFNARRTYRSFARRVYDRLRYYARRLVEKLTGR